MESPGIYAALLEIFVVQTKKEVGSADCIKSMQRGGRAHGRQRLVLRHRTLCEQLTSALGSQTDHALVTACDHCAPNFLA